MQCAFCGIEVPNDFRFCPNCVTIFDSTKIQNTPPPPTEYIRQIWPFSDGPTVKKGLMGTMHRGFAVSVVLADKNGHEIPANGKLSLQVGNYWSGELNITQDKF